MSDNVTLSTMSDSEQGNHYPTPYSVLSCPNHVMVARVVDTSHGAVTVMSCASCGMKYTQP